MKITIINSKGYWKNGWVSSPNDLQLLVESLERNDFIVEIFEVNSLYSLEKILKNIGNDTLILPNAYYVNRYEEGKEKVWLADVLEAHNLPFIGSNSKTLHNVLHKDICQSILQKQGIPVPKFVAISQLDIGNEKTILEASGLTYPAVIKLTAESGSMGMDDKSLVQNQKEAIIQIQTMIQQYQQDVIIEEFLPSNDITISYLQGKNGECKLLTTWYLVSDKPGSTSIMGHKERFMNWGGTKKMVEVKDRDILEQVEKLVPKVCEILKVRDITRVDGRLDINGQLKIFDVNGFPALSFPESVSPQQFISCFPEYKDSDIFDILVNTIVLSAANRYNMVVPNRVNHNHFFMLKQPQEASS
jgi:D-alanine-D-alanine ligase-like ATP-grasp enzyme